ncbi:LuxR C-terminal-related transcriptional regulator [Kitasatospora sp. NPDC058190]|uniref:LuxR C-terminal-related transcriptional regulator n=1 Tax=Kitasatospora sp. NPDC058190 TaxID=3346371 RepID=UPI0036DE7A5C
MYAITHDAPGFATAIAEHRPHATIVDVRLPPTYRDEGIHARRRHPGLPVLVLSQYVEHSYAGELISDGRGGIGYLLKDRVSRVSEFTDALQRVAAGATVMDPEVIGQLLTRHTRDPIASLTPREREVLALMAEGQDNPTIATRLVITDNAVHKHIGNIFTKLGLSPTDSGHRRVLAVLTYLSHHRPTPTSTEHGPTHR